ncbi:Hypothetical_protein [Hexamita inflata]|uniref:Hypothetical_protein n=1 Tax=Hexamita inflata TaxID=28002 RepID=A0ABP1JEI6_9EUKA
MNVKEQFIIPKVFNINRLTIIKCVVDLSTLQGNFGTVQINRCSIIGSLTENLFANIFSVSIYDVLDIKFSQLIDGRIKKIDIQLNNIQQDLDLRGANSKYGRLDCLCFYSKCVVNLAKLEGYWNYVEMSDCYFDKRIQINTFGAKTLCFYQPSQDVFQQFSNCETVILDLQYKQIPPQQNFDFKLLKQCSFATTINLNLLNFQIDLTQITGRYRNLDFNRCTLQGNISQSLSIQHLHINYCNVNSGQLELFSCDKLNYVGYNSDEPLSTMPRQLQKLYVYGTYLNIKNSKQFPNLSEIELEESYVENLSFINVPNIKSLKINQCKPSKSTQYLQNNIKRKKKIDTKLVELNKELYLCKIYNYQARRNRDVLKIELAEIIQLDISEITIGREQFVFQIYITKELSSQNGQNTQGNLQSVTCLNQFTNYLDHLNNIHQ